MVCFLSLFFFNNSLWCCHIGCKPLCFRWLSIHKHKPVWTWVFHSGWPWCTDHSRGRQSYCGRIPWDVSAHSRVQWHRPQIYSGSTVESTSDQLLEKREKKKTRGMRNIRYNTEGSYIPERVNMSSLVILFLTVTFGSVLQTESNGQHGIIFKKLCSKCIPPQVVTLLQKKMKIISYLQYFWLLLYVCTVCSCVCLWTSVQFCSRLLSSNIL